MPKSAGSTSGGAGGGAGGSVAEDVLIGTTVRKTFAGYGTYDGVVVKLLSAPDTFEVSWHDGSTTRMKRGAVLKHAVSAESSAGGTAPHGNSLFLRVARKGARAADFAQTALDESVITTTDGVLRQLFQVVGRIGH